MFLNSGIQQDLQYERKYDRYNLSNSQEKRSNEDEQVMSKNSQMNDLQINQESLMLKISLLMNELITTKEKLYLYEDLCNKLRKQNEELTQRAKDLQKTVNANTCIIEQKIQIIKKMSDKKNQMEASIRDLEQKVEKLKATEPSSKSRKKLKELTKINELLQKQVRTANSQIIELQRTIQDKTSHAYFGEISRLRESNFNTRAAVYSTNMKNQVANNMTGQSFYSKTRAFSSKAYKQ